MDQSLKLRSYTGVELSILSLKEWTDMITEGSPMVIAIDDYHIFNSNLSSDDRLKMEFLVSQIRRNPKLFLLILSGDQVRILYFHGRS